MKRATAIAAVCLVAAAVVAAGQGEPADASTGVFTSTSIGRNGTALGVNLYAVKDYSKADITAYGERTLSYIKDTLHAGAVDIVWNEYTATDTSSTVVTVPNNTLPAAGVAILIQIAQKDGLEVELRPMLFIEKGDSWEGYIKPKDPAEFFGSYYGVNKAYLAVAQEYHVNEFVAGTEMDSTITDKTADKVWPALFNDFAKIYKGQISYTSQDQMYFASDRQIPATNLTGLDMYEPLKIKAGASEGTVIAAYEKYFASVPKTLLRRTAIQEIGIAASTDGYTDPADLSEGGTLDETVQGNYFVAACEAAKKYGLRGVFFWKVDLADNPAYPASSLSTFEGKKGATAIEQCVSILK